MKILFKKSYSQKRPGVQELSLRKDKRKKSLRKKHVMKIYFKQLLHIMDPF